MVQSTKSMPALTQSWSFLSQRASPAGRATRSAVHRSWTGWGSTWGGNTEPWWWTTGVGQSRSPPTGTGRCRHQTWHHITDTGQWHTDRQTHVRHGSTPCKQHTGTHGAEHGTETSGGGYLLVSVVGRGQAGPAVRLLTAGGLLIAADCRGGGSSWGRLQP